MRLFRWSIILLALYFTFIGGSAYYTLVYPIRVFHHIFVSILLAIWLTWRIYHQQGLPQTPLNPLLYMTILVWFITALSSIDVRVAFENLWLPITHLLFFWVIVDLIQRGRQRIIFEALFMMALLVIFITALELASWYFGLGITPNTSIGWTDIGIWIPPALPKVALAMNISTLLAGYSAPLILVLGVWSITVRHRAHRQILALITILMGLVLLLTFSRGGLLSLLTGIGAFTIMWLARQQRIKTIINPALIISGGIIIGSILMIIYISIVLRYGSGASDEGRLDMWRSAIEIAIDNPIDGVGAGLFGRAFRDYRSPELARDKLASAHNAYLNIAAETGLLGLIITGALFIWGARTIWHTYQNTKAPKQRLRLQGVLAALIGVACHSMVDVFTTTPIVLMLSALVAYVIIGPRTVLDIIPTSRRLTAFGALIVIIGYGIIWLFWDSAEGYYRNSFAKSPNAIAQIRQAQHIDPHLRLYNLQESYLLGLVSDETSIDSYQKAIMLEPTWDIGLINLAALSEKEGNVSEALLYLDKAKTINPLTSATLHWARLAEILNAASKEAIIRAYELACRQSPDGLPLADFWWQTPLRQEAVRLYLQALPLDAQYRVLRVHDAAMANALLPIQPQTAADWWILGEYYLSDLGDVEKSLSAFNMTIQLSPNNGDYYASRARAFIAQGANDLAHQDLDRAIVLGTKYEYPYAIRALLTTNVEAQLSLKSRALTGRIQPQEFSAVLYNRPSIFSILPEMNWVGPGDQALQPWYDIADYYLSIGDSATAKQVLDAILFYAPYETKAKILRTNLN